MSDEEERFTTLGKVWTGLPVEVKRELVSRQIVGTFNLPENNEVPYWKYRTDEIAAETMGRFLVSPTTLINRDTVCEIADPRGKEPTRYFLVQGGAAVLLGAGTPKTGPA